MRWRFLWEGLLLSAVLQAGYVLWAIIQGFILTKNYSPAILESYENVDHLQSQVEFGVVDHYGWIVQGILFIGTTAVYMLIRSFIAAKRNKGAVK
ncbi:hypothetical protein ACFQZE_08185 [Paenibacillus sp. GCM10027627]|uniref:hypothetical protein n=1 Tax=unclassified Paenibacillus TaxID=185978 RepID=UPI00363C9E6D